MSDDKQARVNKVVGDFVRAVREAFEPRAVATATVVGFLACNEKIPVVEESLAELKGKLKHGPESISNAAVIAEHMLPLARRFDGWEHLDEMESLEETLKPDDWCHVYARLDELKLIRDHWEEIKAERDSEWDGEEEDV